MAHVYRVDALQFLVWNDRGDVGLGGCTDFGRGTHADWMRRAGASITRQPSAVAVQPDPSSFTTYPALRSSSAMGRTVVAMLRIGRVASDRKSDNISYVIGTTVSKTNLNSGVVHEPIGSVTTTARECSSVRNTTVGQRMGSARRGRGAWAGAPPVELRGLAPSSHRQKKWMEESCMNEGASAAMIWECVVAGHSVPVACGDVRRLARCSRDRYSAGNGPFDTIDTMRSLPEDGEQSDSAGFRRRDCPMC
jgi:hypothetical protein